MYHGRMRRRMGVRIAVRVLLWIGICAGRNVQTHAYTDKDTHICTCRHTQAGRTEGRIRGGGSWATGDRKKVHGLTRIDVLTD